jgi:undecaprenyl diphosphate synthase
MRFLGRIEELPPAVQKDVRDATERTASNTGMFLCIALNYGGRAEIVDAMNAILAQRDSGNGHIGSNGHPANSHTLEHQGNSNGGANSNGHSGRITEEQLSAYLYTEGLPDPDLLIRTSGEMRVSNFLLWQIAYAETFVTETLWPDFNRARLLEALIEFQKRERRYGGIRASSAAAETQRAAEK